VVFAGIELVTIQYGQIFRGMDNYLFNSLPVSKLVNEILEYMYVHSNTVKTTE